MTAAHYACVVDNEDIWRMLVAHGADVGIRDGEGKDAQWQ